MRDHLGELILELVVGERNVLGAPFLGFVSRGRRVVSMRERVATARDTGAEYASGRSW